MHSLLIVNLEDGSRSAKAHHRASVQLSQLVPVFVAFRTKKQTGKTKASVCTRRIDQPGVLETQVFLLKISCTKGKLARRTIVVFAKVKLSFSIKMSWIIQPTTAGFHYGACGHTNAGIVPFPQGTNVVQGAD